MSGGATGDGREPPRGPAERPARRPPADDPADDPAAQRAEPPGPAPAMSDRWTYLLAGCVLAGAVVPAPGPRLVALGCALGALALRRPLLLCAAAALLASFSA
ncbi:MAG: hypothetical protein OXP08_11570, partial [bacterium]|nr:hypothetical protein [bacterium]